MTNHGETTDPFNTSENGGITGREAHRVTLRTPAELADALPYLLGYRPEDSIVLVALHDRGGGGRFGGRARLGIPANPDDWAPVAAQLSRGLMTGSTRRGAPPERMVAYLCQEPGPGETGREVMERLRPLAERLRIECGLLGAPVVEALCISGGRFWSYCCDRAGCCPPEGEPMGLPGTSVLAAAATYAGLQVRGTLRELRARLLPWETGAALEQEIALDTASMSLVPRILDDTGRAGVAEETLALAERIIGRLATARPVTGALLADLRDDDLVDHDEAAALILGLQDRTTRDRAAEWMEGDEAGPALRLWRTLARRCVGPYGEHAAAPLTLAGWVAWSTGDDLEAREALAMALGADPDYLFARLLHQAINEGLDPESIRRCLRTERTDRTQAAADPRPPAATPDTAGTPAPAAPEPSGPEPSGPEAAGRSLAPRDEDAGRDFEETAPHERGSGGAAHRAGSGRVVVRGADPGGVAPGRADSDPVAPRHASSDGSAAPRVGSGPVAPSPGDSGRVAALPGDSDGAAPPVADSGGVAPGRADSDPVAPRHASSDGLAAHRAGSGPVALRPADSGGVAAFPADPDVASPPVADSGLVAPRPANSGRVAAPPADSDQVAPHPADSSGVTPHHADSRGPAPHRADSDPVPTGRADSKKPSRPRPRPTTAGTHPGAARTGGTRPRSAGRGAGGARRRGTCPGALPSGGSGGREEA
ncbi:DUF4192 family protein [Streptomyces sp. NPDC052610]|uniref:DUF4192 family protein n=1 Tax=Streptomyces sp. NPDC052610 TaxID=3154952 RepID=UPI003446FC77